MGGAAHRASTNARSGRPHFPQSASTPPSFLRRQEPTRPHRHSCAGRNLHALSVIPAQAGTCAPRSVIPAQAGTYTPRSVIPAQAGTCTPRSVIPAQAGTHAPQRTKPLPSSPIHPSPLLGGRLGGGCGAPSIHQRPKWPPALPPERIHTSVIPTIPSFLRRQECAQRRRPPGSCLRRNDGEGAEMYGRGDRGVGERLADARSLPPPT